MEKEMQAQELMQNLKENWDDPDCAYWVETYSEELSKLLCSDEALARKFFTECTDEEFDMACMTLEDLADAHGKGFSLWLLENAAGRNLNLDSWYELYGVLINSGWREHDPERSRWTDERKKQYVLDALREIQEKGA